MAQCFPVMSPSDGSGENQPALDGTQFYEKLKETFTRVLPRYFRGKSKVGMSLTGGLDGRMIMSWAKLSPGELDEVVRKAGNSIAAISKEATTTRTK